MLSATWWQHVTNESVFCLFRPQYSNTFPERDDHSLISKQQICSNSNDVCIYIYSTFLGTICTFPMSYFSTVAFSLPITFQNLLSYIFGLWEIKDFAKGYLWPTLKSHDVYYLEPYGGLCWTRRFSGWLLHVLAHCIQSDIIGHGGNIHKIKIFPFPVTAKQKRRLDIDRHSRI